MTERAGSTQSEDATRRTSRVPDSNPQVEWKPHPLVEWELLWVEELNLLEPGELIVELESAIVRWSSGALIVTDRRVLFVRTTLFGRRTKVQSFALDEIKEADARPVSIMKDWGGNVTLTANVEPGDAKTIVFQQIPGGADRANEIVESILRERERYGQRASLTSEGS